MSLVEVSIAVALLGLVAAAAIATLISLNKNAVSSRIMTGAREVVQRNIEAAVGAPFNSSTEPPILTVTGATGVSWDDTGGASPVPIYISRDGLTIITGNLKRIVVAEANPVNADLRRVTFHLDYSMFGRNLNYEISTIRAMDR
ncbi:MAG: hypothetical protein M3R10_07335 [Verrucomicrobiota bacterium]|nr:hypothetical protein [Verrucomicrobiota bacterium]